MFFMFEPEQNVVLRCTVGFQVSRSLRPFFRHRRHSPGYLQTMIFNVHLWATGPVSSLSLQYWKAFSRASCHLLGFWRRKPELFVPISLDQSASRHLQVCIAMLLQWFMKNLRVPVAQMVTLKFTYLLRVATWSVKAVLIVCRKAHATNTFKCRSSSQLDTLTDWELMNGP